MTSKFLLIKNLLLFLNILGLGGIGYFSWLQTKQGQIKKPTKVLVQNFFDKWEEGDNARPQIMVKRIPLALNAIVANLAQVDTNSYYVTFYPVLTFKSDSNVKESSFAPHLPMVRDRILTVSNSKTRAELLSRNGKMKFKKELKDALNTLNLPFLVEEIFFTGFVVN